MNRIIAFNSICLKLVYVSRRHLLGLHDHSLGRNAASPKDRNFALLEIHSLAERRRVDVTDANLLLVRANNMRENVS